MRSFNSSQTLIVIMAHREAQPTVNRHIALWESHRSPILFFTPQNSTLVNCHGHLQYSFGNASHHGAEANKRFKHLLQILECNTQFQYFLIMEYDAICTRPLFLDAFQEHEKTNAFIAGNVFGEPHHRTFLGTIYVHPPLVINRLGLHLVNHELQHLPDNSEHGFWDRLLGLALDRVLNQQKQLRIIHLQSRGLGFSLNTIEPAHFHALSIYLKQNPQASFFHGIKTDACLRLILSQKSSPQ